MKVILIVITLFLLADLSGKGQVISVDAPTGYSNLTALYSYNGYCYATASKSNPTLQIHMFRISPNGNVVQLSSIVNLVGNIGGFTTLNGDIYFYAGAKMCRIYTSSNLLSQEYLSTTVITRVFAGANKIFISDGKTRVYDPATSNTIQLNYVNSGVGGDITVAGDQYVEYNGKVYFFAGRLSGTTEVRGLYESNGTTAGTRYINVYYNTFPESGATRYNSMVVNSNLVFRVFDPNPTSPFYISIKVLNAGINWPVTYILGAGYNDELTQFNAGLYIKNGDYLYYTDGNSSATSTTNKTINSVNNSPNHPCLVWNGKMWGSRYDIATGQELWNTDGTTSGTRLFKDIFTGTNAQGPNSGNPYNLLTYNNLLYFIAADATHGTEIWRSNGASSGTKIFYDLNPGINTGVYSIFVDGVIFANGTDGVKSGIFIIPLGPPPPVPILNNFINSDTLHLCPVSGARVTIKGEIPTGGNGTFTYQWLKRFDSTTLIQIPGATGINYQTDSLKQRIYFTRIVYSGAMVDTSDELAIEMDSVLTPSVSITRSDSAVCEGKQVTFTAHPINGGNSPLYQWSVAANQVQSSSSPTYTNTFATGNYNVSCNMVSNAACQISSPNAPSDFMSFYVNSLDSPFVNIVTDHNDYCRGTVNPKFSITTIGWTGDSPTLQWFKNDIAVTNDSTGNYTFSPQTEILNGDKIKVKMTSKYACSTLPVAVSNLIVINVIPVNPAISTTVGSSFVNGQTGNITDGSCNLLASIGGNINLGQVSAKVTIDTVIHTYNGQPYVQRHYDLEPVINASSASAGVKIFFKQKEFDTLNSVNGTFPDLPSSPNDSAGKSNLRILQFHGTGNSPGNYNGSSITINPEDSNIVWNPVTATWEISFNVVGFSGFYVQAKTPASFNCINAPTSFTAGKTGTSYQWQLAAPANFQDINNNIYYSGTNTNTLTITPPLTSWNSYKYRCKITTPSGFIYSDTTSLNFQATWFGVTDVWEEPSNWNCGVVPDVNTNIIINGGTAIMPRLRSNRSCKSITLNNNATFTVQTPNQLLVTGKAF